MNLRKDQLHDTHFKNLQLIFMVSNLFFNPDQSLFHKSFSQLLAMDVSARTTMKDAAKCDKRCEWQNSANQKKAERILRFQDPPESMLGSERLHYYVAK